MAIKPPLGVSPHWFTHPKRIKELHDAIGRYIEHIEENRHIEKHSQHYKAIAEWAREIEALALLEAELEEREGK
jgi:hypothetical protein